MYHPVDIWGPLPPSAAPPVGEIQRGIYPTRGSEPTSWTQIESPLAPTSNRTFPQFYYLIPYFPRYSPAVPILPAPSGGSVPPPVSFSWRTTTFVPGTRMKRLQSAVSHMLIKPSPPIPSSPQQPTSVASSSSWSSTSLESGVPDWVPSEGRTCHTGSTRGGVDSPTTGLLFCPEVVGEQSATGSFSARTLSLSTPTQGTSIGKGWPERIPYTALVSHPYLDPPPPLGGGGGVASPCPTMCFCCRWAANDPSTRSTLHSGKCALCRSLSLYESPRPVTRQL